MKRDVRQGLQIYWRELLLRCHWVCLAAIVRHGRWIDGLVTAVRDGNLLNSAASFRGLLESVADAHDACDTIAPTLADKFVLIDKAVRGKLKHIELSPELEGRLIHFTHGRKLERGTAFDPSHAAKQSAEYIALLHARSNSDSKAAYRELCELVHPACASLSWFVDECTEAGTVSLSTAGESLHLHALLTKHTNVLLTLARLGFKTPLVSLKVLNAFPYERVHTPALDHLDFSRIPAWVALSQKLRPA